MTLGAILAIILEVFKLINRSGGAKQALVKIQQINQTFDDLKASKTPEDKQNVAEEISEDISGSGPTLK